MDEANLVRIINNEPERTPRLVGVRLMDEEIISEALVQVGVDRGELSEWTVINRSDDDALSESKTVGLSIGDLTSKMLSDWMKSKDKPRGVAYDESFRGRVGKSILDQLAIAVVKDNNPELQEKSKIAGVFGWFAGYGVGVIGAKHGLDYDNFFGQAALGIASGLSLRGIGRAIFSPELRGRRKAKRAIEDNPHLEAQIAKSTLPIYS